MKKIYIYIVGVLLLIFTSCNSIDSKIISEFEIQKSKTDSCMINISDIVDFKWDTMYAFAYDATYSDISKVIGTKPNNVHELTRKLIFTLNDSIVYYEEHSIDIEKLKKNEVVFDIPDSMSYKVYPKEKAIFKVTKKVNPVTWYYLQQIK
jgi:hypothetical protein